MIPKISDVYGIHVEVVKEYKNEFQDFMDRLFNVIETFKKIVITTHDERVFKPYLVCRKDIYKQKKVRLIEGDSTITYIAKTRTKVILTYAFKEFT